MRNPYFSLLVSLFALVTSRGALAQLAPEPSPFPVRFVDRPLTVPKRVLAPELDWVAAHLEIGGVVGNAFEPSLGVAYGITDDLQLELVPLSVDVAMLSGTGLFGTGTTQTKAYYGQFKLDATYRFVGSTYAEVGARVELDGAGTNDTVYVGWGIPVVLRVPRVLRVDTGLFFSVSVPVKSDPLSLIPRSPDIAMGLPGTGISTAAGTTPGIPLILTFQIIDPLFVGADTGFGILSFHGSVADTCYMPLGFHLGGTIPGERTPLVDILGRVGFPAFLLGAVQTQPFSQFWEVGFTARVFVPL
jgi:hypothetical protein